jgi:hypothetical protein
MIRKFRSRYPQGSLISELLTIKQGKYVVRVMVQENSITLGTGLGAEDTLEKAEDIARMRALSTLDLDYNPITSTIEPETAVELKTNLEVKPSQSMETLQPEAISEIRNQHSEEVSVSVPETSKPAKKIKTVTNKPEPVVESTPVAEILEPVVESTPVAEIPEPVVESTPVAEIPEPVVESTPVAEIPEPVITKESISEPQEVISSAATVDYSDIIFRTDIELRRLGWGKEEGRKHLIETYGKKSRHVLSDGELLEFLQYLENLPTPSSIN